MRRNTTCLLAVLALLAPLTPATADVVIGVAAPLSGPDGVFGTQLRRGVEQAVADAAAGFAGQRARVLAQDDGNDPKKAAEVARSLVAARVPVVIGHLSSAASVPASAIYAEAGTLAVAPTALSPVLTGRGLATVFRLCGRDDAQPGVAARYLLAHRLLRVAIVHDRTGAGKALADGVRQALAKAGVRDVLYGSVERDRDAGLAERIKASAAQAVFFGGGAAEAGQLARQLRDAGARPVLLGGAALASDDFPSLAGPAAEGTLAVFPEEPKLRPAAAELLRRLRDVGFEPDATFFYAYAAVQVVQQAAAATRSLEPSTLAAALHDGRTFKTVIGDVSFDGHGDPTAPDYAVQAWRRGAGGRLLLEGQARS